VFVCVYRCCLTHHTSTHKVHKGVFNGLQNSLAYQIQPEKVKALCVCVLSTQRTILLPFTKEYSVQSAAYTTREGSKFWGVHIEFSKVFLWMIAILPTLANCPRKKHWNAGSWIFYVIHTNPCFHTIGLCCAHFLMYTLSQGWVDSPHDNNSVAIALLQCLHIHSHALNLHSSFSLMIMSSSIEFLQQKKRLRKKLDFFSNVNSTYFANL